MSDTSITDLDSPWKEALEHFLPAAMELYFPEAYQQIDWGRGYTFVNKELQRIQPRHAVGRRTVDVLARVYLKAGQEAHVLAHVEVQGEAEEEFPERLYIYSYRLFDKERRPVATFAILADASPNWRPTEFRQEVLGCTVLLEFPTVKLLDFREQREMLENSTNPFAVFTLACLDVLETVGKPEQRLAAKLAQVRRLRDLGLSQEERAELFRLVDWAMALPEPLQMHFDEELARDEEEGKMPFMTSFERRAQQRAQQQTASQAVIQALQTRFGGVPEALAERVRGIQEVDRLWKLLAEAIETKGLDEFAAQLPA